MARIEKENPGPGKLEELGIDQWSPWECEPPSFAWECDDRETLYVPAGRVTVSTPDGENVEVGAEDFVTFPKGAAMSVDRARDDSQGIPVRLIPSKRQ